MDLKIKYNKDKSRMQVVLTVEPARYIHESRVYNTAYMVEELGKKGMLVKKGQCIVPTKVFNYAGLEKCTGTWIFSLPSTPAKKPEIPTPEKSEEPTSKKITKKAPGYRRKTAGIRTANKKTIKKV